MPGIEELPTGPKRILVQTKTQLVPGDDYHERCRNMKNLICQHLWHRNFDNNEDRWYTYNTNFAYEGHNCYFLLDHGQSTTDNAQVLWYKWTGKSFLTIEKALPLQLHTKLKDYPFVKPQTQPKRISQPLDAATRRQIIRARLRSNMKIPEIEVELLKDAEQLKLLKEDIDPRFWQKIDSLMTI